MDGTPNSIPADNLYARLGTAAAPVVLDVRGSDDLAEVDRLVVSAIPSDTTWPKWIDHLPTGKPVVAYCGDGKEVSRNAAAKLRAAAIDASFLEGGIAAWLKRDLPTCRKFSTRGHTWVTRERPKIDRIACPWLIQRFIDPLARFLYVPASNVHAAAATTGVIPFDIEGVEFAHEGDRCSFDTLLRIYAIKDSALDRLATIVRGADTSRHDLAPQCGGLFAISLGLSANHPNDYEMLGHGMVIYDALYVWCRSLQSETHNWPAKTSLPLSS
jgi:rhodanese-related sulfurtransferase